MFGCVFHQLLNHEAELPPQLAIAHRSMTTTTSAPNNKNQRGRITRTLLVTNNHCSRCHDAATGDAQPIIRPQISSLLPLQPTKHRPVWCPYVPFCTFQRPDVPRPTCRQAQSWLLHTSLHRSTPFDIQTAADLVRHRGSLVARSEP